MAGEAAARAAAMAASFGRSAPPAKAAAASFLDAVWNPVGSDTVEEDNPILTWSNARCPPHWKNQDMTKQFDEREEVPRKIVSTVQRMLDATWKDKVTRDRKGPAPKRLEVVSVQRVEDRKMWAAYVQSKEEIRKKRNGLCAPVRSLDGDESKGRVSTESFECDLAGGEGQMDESLNEHYFYHGTSPEGAHGISENGFMINLAGTNVGTMFGKGAYFAEKSSKADEYASTSTGIYKGVYAVLICRVCCGEMFRVTKSDIPNIEKAMKSGRYDAVLGDREASVGTYREFVVFQERMIYPEYVVLYRRISHDEGNEK